MASDIEAILDVFRLGDLFFLSALCIVYSVFCVVNADFIYCYWYLFPRSDFSIFFFIHCSELTNYQHFLPFRQGDLNLNNVFCNQTILLQNDTIQKTKEGVFCLSYSYTITCLHQGIESRHQARTQERLGYPSNNAMQVAASVRRNRFAGRNTCKECCAANLPAQSLRLDVLREASKVSSPQMERSGFCLSKTKPRSFIPEVSL